MQDTLHVLLVDDAEPQYYLIEGYLNQSRINHFDLDWASCVDDALQRVRTVHYDVCLLDYELGEHTGLEVLQYFREQAINVPVIVMTGYGSQDIDIAVMNAGAVDYIDKTMLNAHLLERSIRYTVQQARSLEAVRQSEIRFRAMVEKGSDLIIQLDGQGRVIYTSPSISRILGYGEDEIIGQALLDYVHPDDLSFLAHMFNQLTTLPQNPPVGIYRIRSSQNTWQWFEAVATNLLKTPGIHAIIINARDVTERQQLLRSEQEQRAIAEALLETSNALNSTLNPQEMLSYILERIKSAIACQRANVMLIEEENRVRVASALGYDQAVLREAFESFLSDVERTPILLEMYKERQPALIVDCEQTPLWAGTLIDCASGSYVGVPLIEEDRVIGFVNLEHKSRAYYTERHAETLRLFANQAVIALRNARAYQQGQALAAIEERQRLARELHDVVSQTLFSASVIADSLTRMIDGDKEKLRIGLERLTQLNRSALAEMRTLLVELRPQSIVSTPLPELMRNLANSGRGRANLDIELSVVGNPFALAPDVHLQLYRLAQEILTNVSKHAQARHVQLELRYFEEWVELAIADDGVGFDSSMVSPGHHGIPIMFERAEKIGASIHIDSSPGEGTYIHIRWPALEQEVRKHV